ncbi:MAG: potassium-transporting ATPase subunit KdpC [Ardenticatenaceae bacterium]|nr:potassium-transporting ATPase subunit KdpC [Ardenticatenaceae bacterium]
MKQLRAFLRPAFVLLGLFTLLTGLVYPVMITAVAQTLFPHQANGSLIRVNGQVIGSGLIGQAVADPAYFWGRPSLTSPAPYNAAASAGSNLANNHPDLLARVEARIKALQTADPDNHQPIPVDLVTASASGLDPHISVAAAEYQIGRVATARGLTATAVAQLIQTHSEGRLLGIWGEPCVNVLQLNLALAGLEEE